MNTPILRRVILLCACLGATVCVSAQEQDARAARSAPMFPPQGVTVQFKGSVAIVSWQPMLITKLKNYEIYRWNGKGKEDWIPIGVATGSEYRDTHAGRGGKARYKVVAVDNNGVKSDLSLGKMSEVVKPKEKKPD